MSDYSLRETVKTAVIASLLAASAILPAAAQDSEPANPWSVSVSAGHLNFEGDEPLDDALITSFHLGYDVSEAWTLEGILSYAPDLDENTRRDWRTGERISRLEEAAGAGVHDTSLIGLAVDGLYHFMGRERLDPYLALGAGALWYEDTIENEIDPVLRAGAGVMARLSPHWALRCDGRVLFTGNNTEFNGILTAGLVRSFGAEAVPAAAAPAAAPAKPLDTDGDGLTDEAEAKQRTNPAEADTDKDDLTDREEIETYKTDPLNPDTDYDGLKDGPEVQKHTTDPLKRDTDGGKVADGHEVIEDKTNPKDPKDDLLMFELNMQFDEGKWEIRSEYYQEMDAIAKILKDDAGAKARIEGHDDQRPGVAERDSRALSDRRAGAIKEYFHAKREIANSRMDAVGYGFSRPKAANDPANGNPANRRMEIYIRLSQKGQEPAEAKPAERVKPEAK